MSNQYDPWIQKYTKRNKEDWLLVKAMIRAESDFLPQAVSRVECRGLMQIAKGTWNEVVKVYLKKDYTFEEAFDPEKNIEVGCRYIAWLYSYIKRYIAPSQPLLHKRMLCAYNWGIGNLQKNRWSLEGIPRETKDYIDRIYRYWKEYKKASMVEIPRERLEKEAK